MIAGWLIAIGMWLVCDGIFSLNVYLNAPAQWRAGKVKQTWRRDHWIRLIRIFTGIAVMWFGFILIGG